jgi:hypothetical protein
VSLRDIRPKCPRCDGEETYVLYETIDPRYPMIKCMACKKKVVGVRVGVRILGAPDSVGLDGAHRDPVE